MPLNLSFCGSDVRGTGGALGLAGDAAAHRGAAAILRAAIRSAVFIAAQPRSRASSSPRSSWRVPGCSMIAVDPATVDVRHFSLYPWNGARVLRLAGILAVNVAALWAATLVLITARGGWRLPSSGRSARVWRCCCCGLLRRWLRALAVSRLAWPLPLVGLLLSALACAIAALLARRSRRLVSARDDCRAHLRSVRDVPRARPCCSTRRSTSSPSWRFSG